MVVTKTNLEGATSFTFTGKYDLSSPAAGGEDKKQNRIERFIDLGEFAEGTFVTQDY